MWARSVPRFNHPPIERFEFATENPKGTTAQIDLWIDVAYQGSTLTPIASYATSGKADVLASNAPLSSDASSWGGSTTAFKTSVTITPGWRRCGLN